MKTTETINFQGVSRISNPVIEKSSSKLNLTKTLKELILSLIIILLPILGFTQTNEAEWNGSGYSLKKVVSNTSIQSGVNFSYTILFTAPAGAASVSIQDLIPASLEVVPPMPVPAAVCGIIPTLSVSGPIGSQTVNYNLTGLSPSCAASGSFTIVVKFREGTTCDGETARNRAGIFVNDKWEFTPYVSTTAIAADPWKISKSILSGAFVNPNGGSCGYMMMPDDTLKYRIYVMKNSPYYGNVNGQMNMSSAVVTDVLPTGAVLISSTCGAVQAGNTITWQVNSPSQLLDAAVPYAFYYCDFEIYYPASSFPVGSIINNEAALSGTICNQQVSHTSNQTCVEILNFTPNLSANFQKYISLTNRVPGCSGVYTIIFCNNGNVALSAFDINDAIPSGITVDQIKIYNANATTPVDLNINSSAYATGLTSYYDSGPISSPVNNIQFQMTGSLPVSSCLYMYVYFTIDPNPTGTVITNCASFDGLGNSLTLGPACVDFTVDSGAPNPCLLKDICSPATSYEPGDVLRFRLRIQNIGSATLTGAAIQDVLHSNFNYLGNETYYIATTYNPACSSGGSLPSGTTAWTGVSPSHSGNNLSWSIPDISSDCQLFYTAYCGTYGTSALPYHFIEFDVSVDSLALPGVTPNNYEISGGNLTSTVTSNTVNVLVVASFGQEVRKQLSTDSGSTFSSAGSVNQGGSARFRLNYKNLSNVPVTAVQMVDLLGRNDGTNDWLILNRTVPRGSQFDLSYNLNHSTSLNPTGTIPGITLDYSNILNACLPNYGLTLGCSTNTWGATGSKNIRMDYGAFSLAPGQMIMEDFDVGIPTSAMVGQTACNDFAALVTANFLLNGTPQTVTLTPIASAPICLTVDTTQVSCCDSIVVRQFVDADGTTRCCTEFKATCELDSVKVTVSNGTLSSNSWTCGTTIPSGAVGQSSYTFAANNCVVDMTNCIQADQTGIVTVTYMAYFTNGEKCEKEIQLDCEGGANCCENIKLEAVQSDEGCCVRLVTGCEVETVEVSVGNGLISSANWNCGNIPAGYTGQNNYTFSADSCMVDMTTCVSPYQTGIVTLNYIITFVNGETCEKSIELDCEHINDPCCALVDFKLKHKWPHWNNHIGVFNITNLDPTSPICYVEITSIPSGSFTTGNLIVDGIPSGQVWNPTRIPSSGSLSPASVNSIKFTLLAAGYNGMVNICVVKCDSTRCCFEYKWNNKPWGQTDVPIEEYNPAGELIGVSISPRLAASIDSPVKYVSFGMSNETEVIESNLQFWAVSSADHEGESSPDGLASISAAYMGKHSAFFEISKPRMAEDGLGIFNLVFSGGLPDLGCTLFDVEGNIIASGQIIITGGNDIITSAILPDDSQKKAFEFVKLYPNPSEGNFTVTYITGKTRDIKIQILDAHGKIVSTLEQSGVQPGVHSVDIDASLFSAGIYRAIVSSEGSVLNKSAVVK